MSILLLHIFNKAVFHTWTHVQQGQIVLLSLLLLLPKTTLLKPLTSTETNHVAPFHVADVVRQFVRKKSLNLASKSAKQVLFF